MERSKQKTVGVIHAVPCPWCKRPNDLREMHEQRLLEAGARYGCDHCKRVFELETIDTRPRLIVKQYHGG